MVALGAHLNMIASPHLQPEGIAFEATAKGQIQFPVERPNLCLEPSHGETCGVAPDDDEKKEETQRQAWFENAIKKELNIPNSYLQIAPLIIRWDPAIDEYADGHTKEVSCSSLRLGVKSATYRGADKGYFDCYDTLH